MSILRSIRICDLLLNGNNIQNNLKLIDMCAAPGGKTTYLMQALEGKYEKFVAVDRKTRVVSLEKQLERYSQDHSIQGMKLFLHATFTKYF